MGDSLNETANTSRKGEDGGEPLEEGGERLLSGSGSRLAGDGDSGDVARAATGRDDATGKERRTARAAGVYGCRDEEAAAERLRVQGRARGRGVGAREEGQQAGAVGGVEQATRGKQGVELDESVGRASRGGPIERRRLYARED